MTANSGPTTNQPEPDRPDDAFIAEMLKEHAEARAYLQGFDDHADVIDQPVEHAPEDVVIHDRGQRRWTVTRATTGFVVIVQSRAPRSRVGPGGYCTDPRQRPRTF